MRVAGRPNSDRNTVRGVPAWSTPRVRALLRAERGTWRCSHSPLVAGDVRRSSHTVVGRRVAKCTKLRARSHTEGHSTSGRCYPKASLTSALVRNTRTHKGKKNNEPRGVHPFIISNVVRVVACGHVASLLAIARRSPKSSLLPAQSSEVEACSRWAMGVAPSSVRTHSVA